MEKSRIIRIVFMAFLILSFLSCSNKSVKENEEIAKEKKIAKNGFLILFEEDEYDFGSVNANDKDNEFISKEFVFINRNEKPLIITKADASCGCVSTKIPDKPILKGERGIVNVSLDTKQLTGHFTKNVYVKSNAENDVELLRVTGEIKK
ncbi:DUF1573 domain-containing protein [Prevotella sp. 10(H)]|uniref:DUF1573 domain-containing protein n=1 Tax=Prevotella sp. 10(H) TaxID=1158294 RepID=UPI0018CC553D|nr:DUF1573 domain-containing protein [Prevotella sp. 10(H)]